MTVVGRQASSASSSSSAAQRAIIIEEGRSSAFLLHDCTLFAKCLRSSYVVYVCVCVWCECKRNNVVRGSSSRVAPSTGSRCLFYEIIYYMRAGCGRNATFVLCVHRITHTLFSYICAHIRLSVGGVNTAVTTFDAVPQRSCVSDSLPRLHNLLDINARVCDVFLRVISGI